MRRVLLAVACALALVMAVAPAGAAAAELTDDDFSGGTTDLTEVSPPGTLRLTPSGVRQEFDALPAGWTETLWPPGTGGLTFADGVMTVNGARVAEDALGPADQVFEARAAFGAAAPFEQLGYAVDLNDPPWAIFSTGGGTLPLGFWARTELPGGPATNSDLSGSPDPTVFHDYRIEWAAAEVRFFIDGALVATNAQSLAAPMRPAVSDLFATGPGVQVDWLQSGPYDTGTFVSRPLDAGDARAIWGTLTPTGAAGIGFATRTGSTSSPDASWSSFQDVGAGGAILSRPGRYIQYRATLAAAEPTVSPELESVTISYEIDAAAPRAAIDGIAVSGTSASVSFSSPDADLAGFECSLDGGAFAACTSPATFGGLAPGAHTVAVRAIDRVGNVGSAVTQGFTVAAPPAPPPAPPPSPPPAGSGVAARLVTRSVRATPGGVARLKVKCVRATGRCTVGVRLSHGGSRAGRATVRIAEGATRTVAVRLSARARRSLARCSTLHLTATLTARDTAGARQTVRRALTVAPGRCVRPVAPRPCPTKPVTSAGDALAPSGPAGRCRAASV